MTRMAKQEPKGGENIPSALFEVDFWNRGKKEGDFGQESDVFSPHEAVYTSVIRLLEKACPNCAASEKIRLIGKSAGAVRFHLETDISQNSHEMENIM